MVNLHGRFVWYELHTTDVEGAAAFYTQGGRAGGRRTFRCPAGPISYSALVTAPVSGLTNCRTRRGERGARPSWIGLCRRRRRRCRRRAGSKDLAARCTSPPTDIAELQPLFGHGRSANRNAGVDQMAQNPEQEQPAEFGQPAASAGTSCSPPTGRKRCLLRRRFSSGAKGMPRPARWALISCSPPAAIPSAACFTKPAEVPVPFWLYYFDVPDIDVAAERLKAHGGRIIEGPVEVPRRLDLARSPTPGRHVRADGRAGQQGGRVFRAHRSARSFQPAQPPLVLVR